VRGDITQTPSNVAMKVRQRVTLPCAGDSIMGFMQWELVYEEFHLEQPISYGPTLLDRFKDKFSLNKDGGQFALVFKSPVLNDGGTYRCRDMADAVKCHGDAEIIVFGKTYFSQSGH